MSSVSELIAQAKASEEIGDPGQALVIYEEILQQLEQSPEMLDEALTICTRVGDLRVQLRQPARAFASYRQAAEYGARLGSAEQVLTLCVRMINVVPAAGDAYPRYARRLLEYGHVAPALNVLAEFADKAALETVRQTVAMLAERSMDVQGPELEELLTTIERESHGVMLPTVQSPVMAPEGTRSDESRRTPSRSSPLKSKEKPVRLPPTVSERPPQRAPVLQRSGQPRRVPTWVPIGIVATVGLVVVGIVALRDGNASIEGREIVAAIDTVTDSITSPSSDSIVGRGTAQQSTSPPAAPPPAAPSVATANRPSPAQETAPEPARPPVARPESSPATTVSTPRADTAARVALPPVAPPPVSLSETVDSAAGPQPLVVGDLPVQSVSPSAFRGLSGFRVVQLLPGGTRFTVESYTVDSVTASTYPIGTMIVNVVPPDTTVSIVRYDEQYLVFASGVIPEDSVRTLLTSLHVRR